MCSEAIKLGRNLVSEWLEQYMFAGKPDGHTLATDAAHYFSDEVPVHSLRIDRDAAKAKQLEIIDLESSDQFQDAVLSVHHATIHTLGMSNAVKIVENHLDRTYAGRPSC
jgi:hypothetical protein